MSVLAARHERRWAIGILAGLGALALPAAVRAAATTS